MSLFSFRLNLPFGVLSIKPTYIYVALLLCLSRESVCTTMIGTEVVFSEDIVTRNVTMFAHRHERVCVWFWSDCMSMMPLLQLHSVFFRLYRYIHMYIQCVFVCIKLRHVAAPPLFTPRSLPPCRRYINRQYRQRDIHNNGQNIANTTLSLHPRHICANPLVFPSACCH